VPAGGDRSTGTPLHAGQELRVLAGASQPESVLAVDAERKISWAAGWLEFSGEPVGKAVSEFTRYTDVRIEITQADLANARLRYGRFEIDKPESFAAAVATAVNAPMTRNPKRNVIYIGGKPE
jgi:ferric-dicitrate binding protein FerR (iron transport regulator)